MGRLSTVTVHAIDGVAAPENARPKTTYGYDPLGNLASIKRPDGVEAAYSYDVLNRLKTLTYHRPNAGYPDVLARYDYQIRGDGKRTAATETIYVPNVQGIPTTRATEFSWTYDGLGRLIHESIDHYLNDLDRDEFFVHDLAGNRRALTLDVGRDGATTPDLKTTYAYDANDRLITENFDDGGGSPERTTSYGYDRTRQSLKEGADNHRNRKSG